MTIPTDWKREARRILLTEITKKDMGVQELSRALEAVNVKNDPKVLSNKINRGTFSFMFFLQCMRALQVREVDLKGYDGPLKANKGTGH